MGEVGRADLASGAWVDQKSRGRAHSISFAIFIAATSLTNPGGIPPVEKGVLRRRLGGTNAKNKNLMKKLLILLCSAAFLAGCESTSTKSGDTDDMGDWQSGANVNYDGPDRMWNGGNPNAVPAGVVVSPGVGAAGAVGAGAGATGTKLGTSPP